MLIDAGANTNCKKENFLQFAEMGKIYLEKQNFINHNSENMVKILDIIL